MNEAPSTEAQADPAEMVPSGGAPTATAIPAPEEAAAGSQRLTFRPLLDLIPGMPSGQVCGPDGCTPGE